MSSTPTGLRPGRQPLCRNRYPLFIFIWYFQRKTASPFCGMRKSGKKYTLFWAGFRRNWRVASDTHDSHHYATPLGLGIVCWGRSQGSGVAATLGYGTESPWDSMRRGTARRCRSNNLSGERNGIICLDKHKVTNASPASGGLQKRMCGVRRISTAYSTENTRHDEMKINQANHRGRFVYPQTDRPVDRSAGVDSPGA